MSKAVNSPTARLLQSSRLFSLPRPLPSPDLSSGASTGVFRSSETATTPYPTHQAIATPASSLHRGDWGLKRSLPGKKLRGTNPTVRVRAQDTWEHVTSFESAGDHVRTLEKWGEIGIPMVIKQEEDYSYSTTSRSKSKRLISVYDEAHDITDKERASAQRGEGRWKYDGPWLGGMQQGEFNKWLLRQVSSRTAEWHEFLRKQETEKRTRVALSNARAEGNVLSHADVQQLRPTDQEVQDIQKQLRDEHEQYKLGSELTGLLTDFLDLPSIPREEPENKILAQVATSGLSTERGPPSTHPGVGISHVRTNAIMDNHPIHGPQAVRGPVQGRIVRPRTLGGASVENRAKVGVAGLVADDSSTTTFQDSSRYKRPDEHDPAHALNPDVVGGGKLWVQPQHAYVDEKGRIRLKLRRADPEAIAVKTGNVQEIHALKRGIQQGPSTTSPASLRANFGYSLGVGRPPRNERQRETGASARRQRPGVKGFDDELRSATTAVDELENIMDKGFKRSK